MSEWKKYERGDQVAVLVSPGFGAGWSTWAGREHQEQAMFDSRLVEKVLANEEVTEDDLKAWFGEEYPYSGGLDQVEVHWLDKGTAFIIEEYDGSESLRLISDLSFTA